MKYILVCALLATIIGCTHYRYVPDITPIPARPIIDVTAEFHDMFPARALVSGKESFGLTGPNTKQVAPQLLTDQVEEELLQAFDQAGVFSKITRFDRHPDLILTGRINALSEHYRPRRWTQIPYVERMTGILSILGVKTHLSSGEASLTMFVLTQKGELVGTYRGESSFRDTFNPTGEVAPGDRLNWALTEAVQQIQEKILGDAHLRTIASH
ncbi:MAG: hypothetical protein ACREJN_00825 [Nitrospiraceae bacterium]